MNVTQTSPFARSAKKLHANQKRDLDKAIRTLMNNPSSGEPKTGDLEEIQVYKFRMVNQPTLLAYHASDDEITLIALGAHENFYRDLKKTLH